ncbi:hypothetical protein QUA35_23420 [Microcoleus sp. N9_B2]|uniref:hypothetical protein n=1 Tax=unclassified Microcoleus TaxID=2642155 RepID=UPI002FCF9E29
MDNDQSTIAVSDHHLAGSFAPEVVGFSFYHLPEDDLVVNGFQYVIRIGEKTFRVQIFEGDSAEKGDEKQAVEYLASGETFLSLVQERHEHIAEVQLRVLDAATMMLTLLDDIKSK